MISPLTYRLETFHSFWNSSEELRKEHEEETKHDDRMVRKENAALYNELWLMGLLQVVTVRDGEKMVGYYLTTIQPHTHYVDTLVGHEDAKFLSKPYRKGLNGVKLIKEAEAFLREVGVKYHYTSVPQGDERQERLLKKLAYRPEYSVMGKWIGA